MARLRGADPLVGALGKHLALIGFMGAGKTTIGREVARLTHRPFVDTDEEIEHEHGPIARIFEELGEPEFRRIEEVVVAQALATGEPAVIALGGGAVLSDVTRSRLRGAFTIWIEVDPDEAWRRVAGSDRPLARDVSEFHRLHRKRADVYWEVSDDNVEDVDELLLAALNASVSRDVLSPPRRHERAALVADESVLGIHHMELFSNVVSTHLVSGGEQTKTMAVAERLWKEIRIQRDGTIVAFGGGSVTDLAGFVAATYLRGVRWVAVPTTLTGQVDAAIGGKTGVDLADGKNLVGAFHFPDEVVIDIDVLASLPDRDRRAGMAEVVKTGLLAGRELWELPEEEMISGCAAFKAAVVLSDPYETEGRRTILNLGHTFAHALEAGSGYAVSHGDAVALGLAAALRLSGQPTDVVENVLRPEPVRADPETAWAALKRDKKGEGVFVLLEAPGKPVVTTVPDREARQALESLIRK